MILIRLQKVFKIFEMVFQLYLKTNKQKMIQVLLQKKQQTRSNYTRDKVMLLKKIQLDSEHLLPRNKINPSSSKFYNLDLLKLSPSLKESI